MREGEGRDAEGGWEDRFEHRQEEFQQDEGRWNNPFPSTTNSNSNSNYAVQPSPPSSYDDPDLPENDDDLYSIASSQSGWIVPAPEPERSKERSMLDLGGDEEEGSDEEREGLEGDGDEEEEEEERQEREWLAWKAGEKGMGVAGKREKGSKLDRVSFWVWFGGTRLRSALPPSFHFSLSDQTRSFPRVLGPR